MATAKTVTKTVVKKAPVIKEAVFNEEKTTAEKKDETPVQAERTRKYEPDDLIDVRSVTQGELIMPGKKSGIMYRWYSYGDVTQVEYQDLYTLKSSRSGYLYKPRFVIEDDELLSDPRWSDLKKVYDNMYNEDLNEILKLRPSEFETVLAQMPPGMQNAVKIEVADRIEKGTMDSITMIKAVDRVCGTDLICLVK